MGDTMPDEPAMSEERSLVGLGVGVAFGAAMVSGVFLFALFVAYVSGEFFGVTIGGGEGGTDTLPFVHVAGGVGHVLLAGLAAWLMVRAGAGMSVALVVSATGPFIGVFPLALLFGATGTVVPSAFGVAAGALAGSLLARRSRRSSSAAITS